MNLSSLHDNFLQYSELQNGTQYYSRVLLYLRLYQCYSFCIQLVPHWGTNQECGIYQGNTVVLKQAIFDSAVT